MARKLWFEIDLGENGGRHRFYNAAEVRAWVDRETQFWTEVTKDRWPVPFNQVRARLSDLKQALPDADEWSDGQIDGVRNVAIQTFSDNNALVHSASAAALLTRELAEHDGIHEARGALAFHLPWIGLNGIAMESSSTLKGAMAAAISSAGVSRSSTSAMVKRLNGYIERRESQLSNERVALDEFFHDQERSIAELENEQRDNFSGHAFRLKQLEQDYFTRITTLGDTANESLAAIRLTDAQFREQMRLKAPSEYWEKKGNDHKEAARRLRGWIVGSTVLGAAIYGGLFVGNFKSIKSFLLEFQGSAPALFIITGSAAFILAIPLWFLRILVKFYLSEQHLAADAKERHIMALTYLALSSDSSIAEKDRAIVLGALFRSGQDGLVKDASAPDTSLAGAIARLLEK